MVPVTHYEFARRRPLVGMGRVIDSTQIFQAAEANDDVSATEAHLIASATEVSSVRQWDRVARVTVTC